jgi:hypothetical protein
MSFWNYFLLDRSFPLSIALTRQTLRRMEKESRASNHRRRKHGLLRVL